MVQATIQWSTTAADTSAIYGLAPGQYGVTVTENNCIDSVSFEIQDLTLPIDTTFINYATCNPADSGIFITIITDQNGCDSTIIETVTLLLPSETNIIGNYCAGDSISINGIT